MSMRRSWIKTLVLLMALLVLLGGCKRKKPPLPPPQAEAPAITAPQPPAQPETVPPGPATQPPSQPQPPSPPPKTTAKAKPKPKKKAPTAAKKAEPSNAKPKTTVPPPEKGADNNGQLSASLSQSEVQQQLRTTAQLLDATNANLRGIQRALTSDEQAMVEQIKSYMRQASAAEKDGDPERAHNLALKANLLSQTLVRR
jgi:outer membrane biosynthesis protein TonB